MDFTKFVSLIDSRCLFFSRSDLLDDPFEGSYSHADKPLRDKMEKDWGIDYSYLVNLRKQIRKFTFINCWHASGIESYAMWKLYAESNRAVSILSTYKRLRECLEGDITIALVRYLDYKSDGIPESNLLNPFFFKNSAFRHERELRAIIQELPSIELLKTKELNNVLGKYVPIDLNHLIIRIYIAPTAPTWFFDLVNSVIMKYGLEKNVVQSTLDSKPYF